MLKKAQKLGGDPFEDTPDFTMNQALIFIKPSAVGEAVKKLVKSVLRERSISIIDEGSIDAVEMSSKRLVDNHFFAIASKVRTADSRRCLLCPAWHPRLPPPPPPPFSRGECALLVESRSHSSARPMCGSQATLSKPVELNPPKMRLSDFTAKFDTTWSQARYTKTFTPLFADQSRPF